MPDTPGKRQRREVKAKRRQARDERRAARHDRRAGIAGPPPWAEPGEREPGAVDELGVDPDRPTDEVEDVTVGDRADAGGEREPEA